jgi:ASPM-SPD-2-Hydin domain-containing protein
MKPEQTGRASRSGHLHLASVPLPAKRGTRRMLPEGRGVVPLPTRVESAPDDESLDPATGNLVFHSPCDAPASTTTSNDGGAIISHASLQLLFWGSAWSSNPAPAIGSFINAVNAILQGPYLSGLGQYGVAGGSIKGAWLVTGRDPKNLFSNGDVHGLISDLLDQGSFPEPDDPGGQNLYMFILPANVRSNDPDHTGEHMYDTDYDFPFDVDRTWFGWLTHDGTLDSLTSIFSHELVEACTDPEGDAVQVNPRNDSSWHEICDVCCSTARVNDVLVQSYWSDRDLACIIPAALPELSAPSILEFPPLHLHQPSDPRQLRITNTGAHPVTVLIPLSPAPGLHTTFVWDGGGAHQLAPGDVLDLSVTFSPTTLGLNAGQLKFTANAIGSPFVVRFFGQGVSGPKQ